MGRGKEGKMLRKRFTVLVREWLQRLGVQTLFIEPGSPWENVYVESFNGKFRDEFLNGEIFYSREEAKILIERWRREYNGFRPHSSLNYRPRPRRLFNWCLIIQGR